MLKLLFVTPSFPFPAHSGAAVAAMETLGSIADKCKLHVLTPPPQTDREANVCALKEKFRQVTIHFYEPREQQLPRFEMYTTAALTTVTKKSYWAMSWHNRHLRLAVQNLFAANSFDVVHAEWLQTAASIWDLDLPLVIRTLDVHFLVMQQWSDSIPAADKLRRSFWRVQAERFRVFEARILSSAASVVTISAEDETALRQQGVSNIQTIPPPRLVRPSPEHTGQKDPNRCLALFVGRLDMAVNREAFFIFVDEVWPLINAELRSRCRIVFAGGFPDEALRERATAEEIEILAPLSDSDAAALFANADFFFSPVQTGTGIKIKTVEAMAQGMAMVGFRNAFRGVPAEHGRDALIADSPADFATQLANLINDRSLRANLGRNARQFVEVTFNPLVLGKRLLAVYDKVAGGTASRQQVRRA